MSRAHADILSAAAGIPYHLVPEREHTDVLDAPMTVQLVARFLELEGTEGQRLREGTREPGTFREA